MSSPADPNLGRRFPLPMKSLRLDSTMTNSHREAHMYRKFLRIWREK
jgi:hypothetical protein